MQRPVIIYVLISPDKLGGRGERPNGLWTKLAAQFADGFAKELGKRCADAVIGLAAFAVAAYMALLAGLI